ncbi:hypothetical protein GYH30_044764 [Glycine max]|nr:hypothetical protein GYH30_044764 [Glycine max]
MRNSSFWFTCTHVVLFSATLLCLQPKSTASALGNDRPIIISQIQRSSRKQPF